MRRAVVVKLGSSTLVDARGRPRRALLQSLAGEIAALGADGVPVCVVSSGAIALGAGRARARAAGRRAGAAGRLGRRPGPAASAPGSARCAPRGLPTGQVLLTASDIHARTSYLNARATLETMLGWGVVPVVNENDSTATDEITFGDNDALAAQVAVLAARAPARAADRPGRPLHARPARARRRARARGARPPPARRDRRRRAVLERPGLGRHALQDRRGGDGLGRRRLLRDRARRRARACSRDAVAGRTRRHALLPRRPARGELQAVAALRPAAARDA